MVSIREVAETQAQGNVGVIYSDIRKVLGVPFVNLIYRHLATTPAVLDCVWRAIRPHFVSGAFAAQAVLVRQEAAGIVERWPLRHAGLSSGSARDSAVRLIQLYNEANSLNLTALLHLLGSSSSTAVYESPARKRTQETVERPAATPATRSALPRLPEFKELQEPEVALIHRLNEYAEPDAPTIVASLYRHLAAWPGTLQTVQTILAPLQEQGLLDEGRQLTSQAAARIAAAHPLPIPKLIDAFHNNYETRLRQFAAITISKMIPIGTALAMAFDARPAGSMN